MRDGGAPALLVGCVECGGPAPVGFSGCSVMPGSLTSAASCLPRQNLIPGSFAGTWFLTGAWEESGSLQSSRQAQDQQ